jgi:hypothetical protein
VAWVNIFIVLLRSIELDKMLVQDPAIELVREDLRFLLAISCDTVELVAILKLLLKLLLDAAIKDVPL